MTGELAAQIAVAVLGLLSAIIPLARTRSVRRGLRANLQADISILRELPKDVDQSTQDAFVQHIERMTNRLAQDDQRTRDPTGITLALIFIAGAIAGAYFVIQAGGNWLYLLIPVVLVFILGAVGLSQDGKRSSRDESGNATE